MELLQMLEVTTNGRHSHMGSQTLGEVRRRLADVLLWQVIPDSLQSDLKTFNSSVVLTLARVHVTLPARHPDVIVQWV